MVSSRLKHYRKKKRLTIKYVADSLGVAQSTYRDWENGGRILGEPYVKLAEIFEISVHELLTGTTPSLERMDYCIQSIENALAALKVEIRSLK